jgi:signal peptidase
VNGPVTVLLRVLRATALAWTVVIGLGTLALIGIAVAGWRVEVVATPSMTPAVPEGAAALVEPLDEATALEPGQVILFPHPDAERLVMHRIVDVVRQDGGVFYQTRGDANDAPDSRLVPADDVESRVRASVPRLGDLLHALRPPGGLLWLLVLPWALVALPDLVARRHRGSAPTNALPDPS